MKGPELSQYLQHIEEQLAKLLKSYQDYRDRIDKKQQHNIPFTRHVLYVLAIVIISIAATYLISSFIVNSNGIIGYIAAIQAPLSIGLYIIVVKIVKKGIAKEDGTDPKVNKASIYELDQLRFEILQELATSPIPHNYITPTAIKKMNNFLKKGMCNSIEGCTTQFDRDTNKGKHNEQLKTIQYLHTISYY